MIIMLKDDFHLDLIKDLLEDLDDEEESKWAMYEKEMLALVRDMDVIRGASGQFRTDH